MATNKQFDTGIPGNKNIKNDILVDREQIVFQPLHIKLGLIKEFVKALDHSGDCFRYIYIYIYIYIYKNIYIYIAKHFQVSVKRRKSTGIFEGPQIRTRIRDPHFVTATNATEAKAWNAFSDVGRNFLTNSKAENYQEIVEELHALLSLQALGYRMNIKAHYLGYIVTRESLQRTWVM